MKNVNFLAVSLFLFFAITTNAFAYNYHTNKYGTGYWRDDSNDGNTYNNANAVGLNGRRSSRY